MEVCRSNMKVKEGIGALLRNDQTDETTNNDVEKAEVLSNFFANVFTVEDDNIPEMNRKQVETEMQGLIIHRDDVQKTLKALKQNKSPGPDMLEPFFPEGIS